VLTAGWNCVKEMYGNRLRRRTCVGQHGPVQSEADESLGQQLNPTAFFLLLDAMATNCPQAA